MECTVCKTPFPIEFVNPDINVSRASQISFVCKETLMCKNVGFQGNRIPSIRERIALFVLILFLTLWTIATTYSIMEPGLKTFSGISAELLVYMFLVFMDFCVGFSMIWFCKLIQCLQMSLPSYLS